MASAKTILIEHKIPENTPRRGFFAFCKQLQTELRKRKLLQTKKFVAFGFLS